MKKFTSGADGYMFSLFRLIEENKKTDNKLKERLHLFFPSHCSTNSLCSFDCVAERLHRPGCSRAGESVREKRRSKMSQLVMV